MRGVVSTVVFAAALGVLPALAQQLGAPHQSAKDEAEHLLDIRRRSRGTLRRKAT